MTIAEGKREIEKPPLGKYHRKNYFKQDPDSLEKTLMLGKTEGRRRRGQQRVTWLDGITNSMNTSVDSGD